MTEAVELEFANAADSLFVECCVVEDIVVLDSEEDASAVALVVGTFEGFFLCFAAVLL